MIRERVAAVWQVHRQRGHRATPEARSYTVYLGLLVTVVYAVPITFVAISRLSSWSDDVAGTPTIEFGMGALWALCVVALVGGHWWGPLITSPFVLHVFASSDLPPVSFLRPIALRRLTWAVVAAGVPLAAMALGLTISAGRGSWAGVALVSTLPAVWLVGSAWLWGQCRSWRVVAATVVVLGAALGVAVMTARADVVQGVPALVLLDSAADPSVAGIWVGLVVEALVAVVAAGAAWRSIRSVDLRRLARESTRSATARVHVTAGTFHDALDLYRPEPSGLTRAMTGPDRRLHGHLRQGLVRAGRTPWRSVAGAAGLATGSGAVATGVGWTLDAATSAASMTWVIGGVLVYLGAGWISETWRSLRDELSLAPLLGGRWGGSSRHLIWPAGAVLVGVLVGGAVLGPSGWFLVAGTHLMAFAARFLREMKLLLPVELLTPIPTPYGDVSALRVLAWQFDGPLLVVAGIVGLVEIESGLGRVIVVAAVTAWCWWRGLRHVAGA